jgi:hypothetical protein
VGGVESGGESRKDDDIDADGSGNARRQTGNRFGIDGGVVFGGEGRGYVASGGRGRGGVVFGDGGRDVDVDDLVCGRCRALEVDGRNDSWSCAVAIDAAICSELIACRMSPLDSRAMSRSAPASNLRGVSSVAIPRSFSTWAVGLSGANRTGAHCDISGSIMLETRLTR